MKKWLTLIVVVLLVVAGWIAAGPYLTINAIRSAVQEQDAAKLSQHIDFPALRTSLKQQAYTTLSMNLTYLATSRDPLRLCHTRNGATRTA